MVVPVDAVSRFAALAALAEEDLDLAEAALAIAAGGEPGLDPMPWVAELDRLAEGVGSFDRLHGRLFAELGFTGNARRYHDPANSFLDRVIERRVGIPISLSVLVIEVGRRAGIRLEGIGMPAHFLVREPERGVYLDAFDAGALLDERGCEARFRAVTGAGPEVAFGPEMLPVVTKHEIVARMLANLKAIYRSRGRSRDLEWVQRMRLALPEVPRAEVVELGEALAMQGRVRDGAREVERAAEEHPELSEALLAAARALRARLN